MKLTKYQKEAIVRAIMADIPEVNELHIFGKVQADLIAAMSPLAQELHAKSPDALKRESVYDIGIGYGWSAVVGDAEVEPILKPYRVAYKERQRAWNALSAAVHSTSTLKQLQTLLPEFVKYMPTENEPTKNLPALTNVVADLVKLGWPKAVGAM